MVTGRLLVTTGVNLLCVAVALVVAYHLGRRRVHGENGRAVKLFALWWAAFAADTFLNTLTWLAGGLGVASEPVTAALTYLALASIVLMIWGLTYYLAYLFTGRGGLFGPIAVFYAVSFVLALALVAYLRPVGVTMGAWGGAVAYANEPPPIAAVLFAAFFLLPPIAGALAYGTLSFRVQGRADRYRVLAVSMGIFVWFASSLVLTGAGAPGSDAGALLGKALAVCCLLLILSAYFPPAWLARWMGAQRGGRASLLPPPPSRPPWPRNGAGRS